MSPLKLQFFIHSILSSYFSVYVCVRALACVCVCVRVVCVRSGNFAILLSTGMKWQYVLLVNFFSSLTSFIGFYIGVGVGLTSAEANSWLLAVAAGTFLYVALVDLVCRVCMRNK